MGFRSGVECGGTGGRFSLFPGANGGGLEFDINPS